MPTYDAFAGRTRNPFWSDPRYGAPEVAPQGIAPPDIAGALADPQFRADIIRGLQDAGLGTLQGLTTDALGAPVDILNMAMQPFGVGSETPVGGSEWLQRHAVEAGLMDPPKDNLQYKAGRLLGPIALMGIPDMAGAFAGKIADAAVDFAGHSGRLNPFAGQAGAIVYHGSPHRFSPTENNPLGEFDLSRAFSGEGAHAEGFGTYLADRHDVAKNYADTLSERADALSDWFVKPANEAAQAKWHEVMNYADAAPMMASQTIAASGAKDAKSAAAAIRKTAIGANPQYEAAYMRIADMLESGEAALTLPKGYVYTTDLPDEAIAKMLDWDGGGESIYREAVQRYGSPEAASAALKNQGIPGIRYLDGGSRGAGQGTSNYVVFDDKLPKILKAAVAPQDEVARLTKEVQDDIANDTMNVWSKARTSTPKEAAVELGIHRKAPTIGQGAKRRIVGAPPQVHNEEDVAREIVAYADRIRDAEKAGVPVGYFYDEGGNYVRSITNSPQQTKLFTDTYGVTSSQTNPISNTGHTIRAFDQAAVGAPIRTGRWPNQNEERLTSLFGGNPLDAGIKEQRYGRGLLTRGGLTTPDGLQTTDRAVGGLPPNDEWEATSLGFNDPSKLSPSTGKPIPASPPAPQQGDFIDYVRDRALKLHEARTGEKLTQHQGQELNWAAVKMRDQGTNLGEFMRNTPQTGGRYYTWDYPFETLPGKEAQPSLSLDPTEAADLQRAAEQRVLLNDQGKNRVADIYGALQGKAHQVPSVWEGEVHQGVDSPLLGYKTKAGMVPETEARMLATERTQDLMFGQDAGSLLNLEELPIPVVKAGEKAPVKLRDMVKKTDTFLVKGVKQSPQRTAEAMAVLKQRFGDGAVIAPYGPDAVAILNVGDMPNEQFRDAMMQAQPDVRQALGGGNFVPAHRGSTSVYDQHPWSAPGNSPVTQKLLEVIDNPDFPGLTKRADSAEMRKVMGDGYALWSEMKAKGKVPNEKIVETLRVWSKEGLKGVRRLVEQGAAPVVFVSILNNERGTEP